MRARAASGSPSQMVGGSVLGKLRVRLVLAALAALLIVLGAIVAVVGAFSMYQVTTAADETLEVLARHDGRFPAQQSEAPEASAESRYETRYFSVALSGGTATDVDTESIAAVGSSQAVELAGEALRTGRAHGFIGDYRYLVVDAGGAAARDGEAPSSARVIFLDCSRSIEMFRTFILTSLCVCSVAVIAVLGLVALFSGRIVRPFLESYTKQRRFITDAGHELKTPLTIIDADATVLEMDHGPSEWLDDIKAQVVRLTELTNNLIMLARMEEGETRAQMLEFSLSDAVDEELDTFRSLAITQDKTLAGTIEPLLSMLGDEASIRQLVRILLDNAMKYTEAGGRITLSLTRRKRHAVLVVENTAQGVTREQLDHMFERFYRSDASRNSKTGGYGLGLSISAAIVARHKGKISAATTDGSSLAITVTLPATQARPTTLVRR